MFWVMDAEDSDVAQTYQKMCDLSGVYAFVD